MPGCLQAAYLPTFHWGDSRAGGRATGLQNSQHKKPWSFSGSSGELAGSESPSTSQGWVRLRQCPLTLRWGVGRHPSFPVSDCSCCFRASPLG